MHQRSAWAIFGGTLIAILTCVPPSPAQDTPVAANGAPVGPATAKSGKQIPGKSDGDHPILQHRNARYQLCASDAIVLTFPLTPEFDQTVNVQPDGFVSLAGAGDVHLEGLTTREAVVAVQVAYAKILHDPLITIELKDFNKPYFTVGGEVSKPGKFDLRGYTTATEAVAIAGGFNDSAKHSQVLLFRRKDDNWTEVTTLDLKHVLKGLDINEDPEIRPGDMLFVPQNFLSKIKKFIPNSSFGGYYTY
ncbi:MAG: polysaccharide biosynthesis/export family protein [Candidatus Acidiferrales bacterium]|jgi:polysaccharide export outer membrane protein